MIDIWKKPNIAKLTGQSLAYLVGGIFLSISHYFHEYSAVVFFGHLLISSSLLILISIPLKLRWMHRIAAPLGTFSGAIFIISFAAGVIIFFIDEFVYYKGADILPDYLIDSLFITVLVTVFIWVLLLSIPYISPVVRPRLPLKMRLPSYMLIVAILLFVINYKLELVSDHYFLLGELLVLLAVMTFLNRDKFAKFRRTMIYLSHFFLVLFFAFGLGSILACFTKAASYWLFLIPSFASLGLFIISILLLNHWRGKILYSLQLGTVAALEMTIQGVTTVLMAIVNMKGVITGSLEKLRK